MLMDTKLLKVLILLIFFGLSHCGRMGLDDNRRRRGTDYARGLDRFNRDDIRFNYEDLSQPSQADCRDYNQGTSFSLLPPVQKLQRCLNKWIDTGLAPICEHEQKLYTLLEEYDREGAPYDVLDAIEQEIIFNEEQKYIFADSVYAIADEVDYLCTHLEDLAHTPIRKKYEWLEFLQHAGRIAVNTECHTTTHTIDQKARIVCHRIDFSKIKARRR